MSYPIIQFLLLLTIISTCENLLMHCYSDAGIHAIPTDFVFYNQTLYSCMCSMIPDTRSAFQYDYSDKSCHVFVINPLRSNLQVKITSTVCFVNRTSTSSTGTSSSTTVLPLPPVGLSTVVESYAYYATEKIIVKNNVTLTSLSILIIAPKTFGATAMGSFTNLPGGSFNKTISEANNTILFNFFLLNGSTLFPNQWEFTAQYNLIGQIRPTSNDTYTIRMPPYQDIVGNF